MFISFRNFFLTIILSITSLSLFSQNHVDQALSKLNKVHHKGRLMFTTKTVPEIFLNKEDKILDMGDYSIPIENIKISYSYEARNSLKYHGVKFSCYDGESCIEVVGSGHGISIFSFFKTKKDCYDFINAFNELKRTLD